MNMPRTGFTMAIQALPEPPCEKGCSNLHRCSQKGLACTAFLNYVVPDSIKKRARNKAPNRGLYLRMKGM